MKKKLMSLYVLVGFCASCSSTKNPVDGPVCVVNRDIVGFSCGNDQIEDVSKRIYTQRLYDVHDWVCYPPETNEELIKKAIKGSK